MYDRTGLEDKKNLAHLLLKLFRCRWKRRIQLNNRHDDIELFYPFKNPVDFKNVK